MKRNRVLLIEDEKLIRWSLRQTFEEERFVVEEATEGRAGLELLGDNVFDMIMLDYKLPDITGLEVLREVRKIDDDVVVIMMTAYGNVEDAVEAMKLGAFDYVNKPFNMSQLMLTVQKGLETTLLRREVRDYRQQSRNKFGLDRIIGNDASMQKLCEVIREVCSHGSSTIFLRGGSGTGKDLIAKTIHYNSNRSNLPFLNITCTALAETLLESELFGHERGAFTDARSQKKGLLELADGGTVFLDEVGDMPPALQAKLLRFLEERAFRRVGGTADIEVDVRVIAATNRDIEKAIADGSFREDLYYRLNIIPIHVPPVRERGDDAQMLAKHFVTLLSQEFRKPISGISPEALEKINGYAWPGNVREIRNACERAVLLSKNEVLGPEDFVLGHGEPVNTGAPLDGLYLPPGGVDLNDVERELVRQALQRCENNQTKAAKLLHLSRDQLRYRMEKFGMLK